MSEAVARFYGVVRAVSQERRGGSLVAAAASGATVLQVDLVSDFSGEGGTLLVEDPLVDGALTELPFTAVDHDLGTVTLGSPMPFAAEVDSFVQVAHEGEGLVDWVALVDVAEEDVDTLTAAIPHALIPYFREGMPEGEGLQVFVEVDREGSTYVANIDGHAPVLDAVYVDPETLPDSSSVYRGPTPPWANGSLDHADDINDLWYDTTPLNGIAWAVVQKQLTSNVATLTTEQTHDVQVGWSVSVNIGDAVFDGTYAVTAVGASTVSYARTNANVALAAATGTVQGLAVGAPANVPYMWTGTVWTNVSDPQINLSLGNIAATVVDNQANIDALSSEFTNVAEVAYNAQDLATTADGRVSFSDYEPSPDDVSYLVGGTPVLRPPGSVWFTRTRARINECQNPSFETNATGWTLAGATGARVDPSSHDAVSGSWVYQLTNTGAFGGVDYAMIPTALAGETWAGSIFALPISGANTGCYAVMRFYNSADVLLSTVNGTARNLVAGDWQELDVVGTAPANTAKVMVSFRNPTSGDVWQVDACMIEHAEFTGRYFDGTYDDSSWEGAAHGSRSVMAGAKITRVFELYDNGWVRLSFTDSALADIDAGQVTHGVFDGGLLGDNTVAVDKMVTNQIVASTTLDAGDLVNVWSNTGLFQVRKADASLGREAHGFVLTSAAIGNPVAVYTSGYNPLCAGLTPGRQFLSTAGESSGNAPTTTGHTVQRVGFASDETTLHFAPGAPMRVV